MVEIGNGITTDGPISGAQASAPGQAPMLDENSLIPEAFIPKSASGGGALGVSGHPFASNWALRRRRHLQNLE